LQKKEQNEHEIHLKMRLENMFFKVNAKLIKNPSHYKVLFSPVFSLILSISTLTA